MWASLSPLTSVLMLRVLGNPSPGRIETGELVGPHIRLPVCVGLRMHMRNNMHLNVYMGVNAHMCSRMCMLEYGFMLVPCL